MNKMCHFCSNPLTLTGDICKNNDNLQVGKCQVCDLTQLCDFSHVTLEYYEADDYFPINNLEALRQRELHWNLNRMSKLFKFIPEITNKKILDFGCGHGGFLEQAQNHFDVVGFDVSKRICSAHEQAGWKCSNSLEDIPSVNVITLFHVLEHMVSPWELLITLQNKFNQAKTFVIEVPNTDEALKTIFENEAYCRNHFSSEHLYYFTAKTLRQIVESANLEIILDTQLQRYTLANNFGWLKNSKGGGQDIWTFFNDKDLNEQYERVLASKQLADSIFFICRRNSD